MKVDLATRFFFKWQRNVGGGWGGKEREGGEKAKIRLVRDLLF